MRNSSRILEESSGSNWDEDKYIKVREGISRLQDQISKNLDSYTNQYLLRQFDAELKSLEKQHQRQIQVYKDELDVRKANGQKEHQRVVELEKQQNQLKNLQRIKLTQAIQKMNEQARQAEGRMQKLKDQSISDVTTLELNTKLNEEKQALLKEKQQLKENLLAVSALLKDQENKYTQKIKAQQKLEEKIRQLTSKTESMEKQLQRQKQSRIDQEIKLQRDYNKYKQQLKDTYEQLKNEKYERKIKEKEAELSNNKRELDMVKLSLSIEKNKVQEMETNITSLNEKLKKQQEKNDRLKIQLNENSDIIAQFQKTSQEITLQQKQRQSHIKDIKDLQSRYSSSVENVETNLTKNYQNLFKKLKNDYQLTMNKVANDLNTSIKQEKEKHLLLQQKFKETEERHRQTIKMHEEANTTLDLLVDEREETIRAIARTIIGVRPKENDFSRIKESIENKFSQLVAKLDAFKLNEESFKAKEQSWQKQLQELNRWLRNTSNLLKSQQVQDIFSKSKKYSTNDKELRDVLNKFSENLHGRLRKDKEEISSKVSQISQLKRQQQKDTQTLQNNIKKLQEGLTQKESQLTRLRFAKREFQRHRKEDQEKNSKVSSQLQKKVDDTQRQIKDYMEKLAKISAQNKSLQKVIDNYENATIPALNKRITEEISKGGKLDEKSANLQKFIQTLEKDKRLITSEKEKLAEQNASYLSEIRSIREESSKKENQHADQLKRLREAIKQSYGVQFSSDIFQSILEAIKDNKSSKPLATSVLLQHFNPERNTINKQIVNFLKDPKFKATFQYRYDDFHKNFSNYLPINESFDFLVICRIKNVIFGVISKGLGANSQALLFNANTGKSFAGDINTNSSQYEGGNLVFGYGEVRFKNNTNMQFIVNVRAFGNKYFNFKKEDIIGKEEATVLEALEIYRIDH